MILLGELALWIALLMAVWSALVSYAGARLRRADLVASGERAMVATFGFVALASAGLWGALLASDISLRYVAAHTAANLPTLYKLTAFWAGPEGMLLLWCLAVALVATLVLGRERHRNGELLPYVVGTLATILALLLVTATMSANPFEPLGFAAPEGRGMDPLLQHPAMVLHPPALSLGYAMSAVPFALTIAALITRSENDERSRGGSGVEMASAVGRWALLSWLFLTLGIATGLWWGYAEPSLAGRWAWTPIDRGWLLPWLTCTALLHAYSRSGSGASRWTVALATATFILSLLGAVIALGGVTGSVSAFVRSPSGVWFGLFAVVSSVLAAVAARSSGSGLVARHAVPWKARRYAAHATHLGAALALLGIGASAFATAHERTVAPGASFTADDPFGGRWTFTSQGVSQYPELNRQVTALVLEATRDGGSPALIKTERRQYVDIRGAPTFDPSTEPGILGSLRQDVYVVLERARRDEHAVLRVGFRPLTRLVWLGSALMLVGGLVTLWPRHAR